MLGSFPTREPHSPYVNKRQCVRLVLIVRGRHGSEQTEVFELLYVGGRSRGYCHLGHPRPGPNRGAGSLSHLIFRPGRRAGLNRCHPGKPGRMNHYRVRFEKSIGKVSTPEELLERLGISKAATHAGGNPVLDVVREEDHMQALDLTECRKCGPKRFRLYLD